MTKPQIIEIDGKPAFAVVPYDEWQQLAAAAEEAADIAAFNRAVQRLGAGAETFPAALVDALLDGANPVRCFREHRGLDRRQLAAAAGLSPRYLGEIEAGRRGGSLDALRRIAAALSVDLDMLTPAPANSR